MMVWALLAGCLGDTTGAALTIDYLSETDVEGFHFRVDRVACDASDAFSPYVVEGNIAMVDGIFPAQVTHIEQTLSEESRHTGGDLFLALNPGCYDLVFTPASFVDGASWLSSGDCGPAQADGVEVLAGQTTEVLLLSQCDGSTHVVVPGTGNRPPVISTPPPDRTAYECEATQTCLIAYDPDDDAITVDWHLSSTRPLHTLDITQTLIGFELGHRVYEICADIVGHTVDDYALDVVVQDTGGLTAEAWHDVTVDWIDDPFCVTASGAVQPDGAPTIDRVADCTWTPAEEWYCSGNHPADPTVTAAVCVGATLDADALYPSCPGGGGPGGGGPQ